MATEASTTPVLESGDRLTRAEFHRRYCARPDIKKAELVQGVVYVASPASNAHGEPFGLLNLWLWLYVAKTAGVRMSVEGTVYLDVDTEVQPDAFLYRDPSPPGGARLTKDNYIEGAPQLVAEVAASSASYDLHDKMEAYRRAGVPEYIVWQILEGRIDWFRLRNGAYVPLIPNKRGVIESEVFPGLRLAVAKLLAGDNAGVLAVLRRRR